MKFRNLLGLFVVVLLGSILTFVVDHAIGFDFKCNGVVVRSVHDVANILLFGAVIITALWLFKK